MDKIEDCRFVTPITTFREIARIRSLFYLSNAMLKNTIWHFTVNYDVFMFYRLFIDVFIELVKSFVQ